MRVAGVAIVAFDSAEDPFGTAVADGGAHQLRENLRAVSRGTAVDGEPQWRAGAPRGQGRGVLGRDHLGGYHAQLHVVTLRNVSQHGERRAVVQRVPTLKVAIALLTVVRDSWAPIDREGEPCEAPAFRTMASGLFRLPRRSTSRIASCWWTDCLINPRSGWTIHTGP